MASGSAHGQGLAQAIMAAQGHHPLLEGSSSSPKSSNSSFPQSASQLASAAAAMSSSSPAAARLLAASDSSTQLAKPAGSNLAPLTTIPAPATAPAPTSPILPTPFLMKTYELVDDPTTDDVISWSSEGKSFVTWSPDDLCQQLLPRYFKHSNFASFVRQLNTYGFCKISLERWEFANDDFQRGQKHLLGGIHRRRSPGAARPPALPFLAEDYPRALTMFPSCGLVEAGHSGVEDEIERLKVDKSVLTKELVGLQQHLDSTMGDLHTMWERLQKAERCQEHMVSFIYKAMNHPGFLARIGHRSSPGIAPKNRGLIDANEPTSSGATEISYDSAPGLFSGNDIVSSDQQEHVSVCGGEEAELSTQAKPNWDEVRLVDSPLKTLDELVKDAKLMSSASMNKSSYTHPHGRSFMAAQDSGLSLCTPPQTNEGNGLFGGATALCTSGAPAVHSANTARLIAPHSGYASRKFLSPLKPSDQHCTQTDSIPEAAEQFFDHGVDGISSWRSSAPGVLRTDVFSVPPMCDARGAAFPHQSNRYDAVDGCSSRKRDKDPTAADRYDHFNAAGMYATYGAAIDPFYNVPINPSGWLENPLVGALETWTTPPQEEGCPVVHEEAKSAPG